MSYEFEHGKKSYCTTRNAAMKIDVAFLRNAATHTSHLIPHTHLSGMYNLIAHTSQLTALAPDSIHDNDRKPLPVSHLLFLHFRFIELRAVWEVAAEDEAVF